MGHYQNGILLVGHYQNGILLVGHYQNGTLLVGHYQNGTLLIKNGVETLNGDTYNGCQRMMTMMNL